MEEQSRRPAGPGWRAPGAADTVRHPPARLSPQSRPAAPSPSRRRSAALRANSWLRLTRPEAACSQSWRSESTPGARLWPGGDPPGATGTVRTAARPQPPSPPANSARRICLTGFSSPMSRILFCLALLLPRSEAARGSDEAKGRRLLHRSSELHGSPPFLPSALTTARPTSSSTRSLLRASSSSSPPAVLLPA